MPSRFHVDAFQLCRTNHAHAYAGLDRDLQHLLGSGFAQPLAPARHARRIDRHPMLKVPLAAEVLPVGVLNPNGNHIFITQVMLVLQVMQRNHQPCRDAGRALAGVVSIA